MNKQNAGEGRVQILKVRYPGDKQYELHIGKVVAVGPGFFTVQLDEFNPPQPRVDAIKVRHFNINQVVDPISTEASERLNHIDKILEDSDPAIKARDTDTRKVGFCPELPAPYRNKFAPLIESLPYNLGCAVKNISELPQQFLSIGGDIHVLRIAIGFLEAEIKRLEGKTIGN